MKVYKSVNQRYKLAKLDQTYYLLDMDSTIKALFFPTLVWLFPFKAFELEQKQFEQLVACERKEYGAAAMTVLSILIGRPVSKFLIWFMEKFIVISTTERRWIYLVLVAIILLFFRYLNAVYNQYRMKKRIPLTSKEVIILSKKESISHYYKRNSLIRLMLLFLIAGIITYTTIFYDFDFMIVFIIGMLIFIFLNRSYLFPHGSTFDKENYR